MAERSRARPGDDGEPELPPLMAREAVDLAREHITGMTGRESVQTTSVAPTRGGGWLVEVEVVEDRRIPSSSDILALYEVELDVDGELLTYRRTRRYMRGQTGNGNGGGG
ncbi:gas vesicle protein GvpO [Mycobacterium sp. IS-1496]|uniref:gas vesicle protein GvpO n=1 Tax=Mycobacterium sp. IS-1496 TaxID=1772284 RepID=UPI0007417572|nr:gas vesicle protein GvpO [Mycobacterium sp. IS-1496]KUI36147.1 gas vesicle protein GvpO [Mycobacterium sp. IS-1496]